MKAKLTIAIQCHNFQRRLCWMLSSLAQQADAPAIAVDIAAMPNNGTPSTETLAQMFSGKLAIRLNAWPELEQFQYRGIVRNDQLKACSTEWLMFADCDMVYHPNYFSSLLQHLYEHHHQASYILSSGRVSNPKEVANALISKHATGREISEAWTLADGLPKRKMANVGAGFCQIINRIHCPHGGYYVDPQTNKDWAWSRCSNPRSDMQFRRRIESAGGARKKLPRWFTFNAIHLNHNRDPEVGRHLTEQR